MLSSEIILDKLVENYVASLCISLHVQKMKVAEMRMLRLMYEHTRRNRIRNEDIRDKVGVTFMVDKIREARLR